MTDMNATRVMSGTTMAKAMVCDDSDVGLRAVPPAVGESTKSDVVEMTAAARVAVTNVDA